MKGLTLNTKEQARLQVLNGVLEGDYPVRQAVEILGMSERGLTITCVGSAGRRPVTLRAFFPAWIVLAIPMLIIGAVSVVAIKAL